MHFTDPSTQSASADEASCRTAPPPPPWSASSARWPAQHAPPSRRPTGSASKPGPGPAAQRDWFDFMINVCLPTAANCRTDPRRQACDSREHCSPGMVRTDRAEAPKPVCCNATPHSFAARSAAYLAAQIGVTCAPYKGQSAAKSDMAGSAYALGCSRCWVRPGTRRTGCP